MFSSHKTELKDDAWMMSVVDVMECDVSILCMHDIAKLLSAL